MPTGYPAGNFHTENIRQFAADIDKASAGKLKITVHDGGSLFKANEIKRAVQGGQADIGEIIISGFSNEDPMFAIDAIPFLATSYPEALKLAKVSKAAIDARFIKQGLDFCNKFLLTYPLAVLLLRSFVTVSSLPFRQI